MPSRDPATPGGRHAAWEALTEAEAKAAEAAAEVARAREQLLKSELEADPTEEATGTADTEIVTAGGDPTPAVANRFGGRTPRLLLLAAAVLAVLTIGGLITVDVLILNHHRGVAQRQHQTAEYAAAARQGVVTLMSLNYETVDADVQAIIDNSTGEFRKDFESHAADFAKVARESKTVTTVDATYAGVESMTDTEAVVLVAASTKVTNTAGAKEEPRNWRLTVHLAREGGQVKMSKVDFAA